MAQDAVKTPTGHSPSFSERLNAGAPTESFWRSLQYFHLYRLLVAALFGLALIFLSASPPFGSQNLRLTEWLVRSYLLAATLFYVLPRWRPPFNLLLTVEVAVDVLVLTLLMHLSGGNRSGISYMLLVVLAGAGLVGQGRLTLFYAAMASVAVLVEQAFHQLQDVGDLSDFTYTGVICVGFFGTAISAHLLSKRVVANEHLARQRGEALAAQMRINEQVIQDMQDGILVLDREGKVRQHNPKALELCQIQGRTAGLELDDYCPELARRYAEWSEQGVAASDVLLSRGARPLRVRYLPAGDGENSLLYLEDAEQLQAQARQIKLAALGRLTANMAHEIRNPLAAISHATELLQEDGEELTRKRLLRIIGENTQRLNRLVTDVLELGRRDRTQREPIPLDTFLAGFLEELALTEPEGVLAVRVECPPGLVLRFDRGHLNRLLTNLVGNAMRYCSGRPGSIAIRCLSTAYGSIEIHVVDDGPGIDPGASAHVFEPFFTTRSNGTGLGLYIARELCEANGAALDLMGSGSGAHFRISGKDVDGGRDLGQKERRV
ncbi:MAG: PAS domain-containing protein [Rhodocyclaceae bacterium]|nr:MAG: PAS domain-containing protein [Rhodocyclaceae bacterium]